MPSITLPTVGESAWGNKLNTAVNAVNAQVDTNTTAIGNKLDTSAAAELIRDTMGTALVAGANVTITPNDAGDTITIAATGGGSTDPEVVRDTMATALVAGSNVTITPNDAGDTITIAASASGGSGSGKNWMSGIWGLPGTTLKEGISNESTSADTLYMVPFKIDTAATVTGIAINVGTAGTAATNARLGIYSKDATGAGWTRVNDTGTVSIATTGDKQLTGLSISLANPGIYGVAVICQSACSLNCRGGGMSFWGPASGSAFNSNLSVHGSVAQAYGALPAAASPTGQGSFGTTFHRAVVTLA